MEIKERKQCYGVWIITVWTETEYRLGRRSIKWTNSSKVKVQSQRRLGNKTVSHHPPTSPLLDSSAMLGVARIPTKEEKMVKANFTSISNDRMPQWYLGCTLIVSVYSWNKGIWWYHYPCFIDELRFRELNKPAAKGQKPGFEPKVPRTASPQLQTITYKTYFWVLDQGEKEIITALSFKRLSSKTNFAILQFIMK